MIGGKLWTARLLADIGPDGEPVARIPIKITDYPALQNSLGSVQFKFTATIDLPAPLYYPFTLTRSEDNQFFAVDTRCSHQGCVVDAYSESQFAMICQCHGSEYSYRGEVITGPANFDLQRYATEFDGLDTVTVLLPGLNMKINSIQVQSNTTSAVRVRLDFPAIVGGRYRIQFREDLNNAPLDAPFSATPTGAANLTQILGTGAIQTVYVDAEQPRGFFAVALVVDEFSF
ncbi:MAG: Rieske (2Fe-2S) protein [Verrucomicrobiales bacterium]